MKRLVRILFPALLLLLCVSCAGSRQDGPAYLYAMDGPPLALAGKLGEHPVEGSMDRSCIAGVGSLSLRIQRPERSLTCTATLDFLPNEKNRIKGVMRCDDADSIFFTMRNIGPDQGFGMGRVQSTEELLIFFYHPSREEAERRLPGLVSDIQKIRDKERE